MFSGVSLNKKVWHYFKKIVCKLCCCICKHRFNKRKIKSYPKILGIWSSDLQQISGYYKKIHDSKNVKHLNSDYNIPYFKSMNKNHEDSHYICYYQPPPLYKPPTDDTDDTMQSDITSLYSPVNSSIDSPINSSINSPVDSSLNSSLSSETFDFSFQTPKFSGWIICDQKYKKYRNIAIQTSNSYHLQDLDQSEQSLISNSDALNQLFNINNEMQWKAIKSEQWKTTEINNNENKSSYPMVTFFISKFKDKQPNNNEKQKSATGQVPKKKKKKKKRRKKVRVDDTRLPFNKIGRANLVELKNFRKIRDSKYNSQKTIDINGDYYLVRRNGKARNTPTHKMIFYHTKNKKLKFHYTPQYLLDKILEKTINEDDMNEQAQPLPDPDGSLIMLRNTSRSSSISSIRELREYFNKKKSNIKNPISVGKMLQPITIQHDKLGVVALCTTNPAKLEMDQIEINVGNDDDANNQKDEKQRIERGFTLRKKQGATVALNMELLDVSSSITADIRVQNNKREYYFGRLLGFLLLILGSATLCFDIIAIVKYFKEGDDHPWCRWKCYALINSNTSNIKQALVFMCLFTSIINSYNVGSKKYLNYLNQLKLYKKFLYCIYAFSVVLFLPVFVVYFIPFAIIYGLPIRLIWLFINWAIHRCKCGREKFLFRIRKIIAIKSPSTLWLVNAILYLLMTYLMILFCVPAMDKIYRESYLVYFHVIGTIWERRKIGNYIKHFQKTDMVEIMNNWTELWNFIL